MSIINVKVDPATDAALGDRARQHGVTPEEEARNVLAEALAEPDNMFRRLRARFAPIGGVELPIPERPVVRELPMLFTLDPYDEVEGPE